MSRFPNGIFGTPLQQQSLQRNAPTTTLNLSLRGTLADADPRSGIAVIADAQGNERAWRVGEEIVAGVILDEVHSDRVVLKHDGVQEILALARDEAAERVAPIPPDQRGGKSLRNAAPGPATDPGPLPIFAPRSWPMAHSTGRRRWTRSVAILPSWPAMCASIRSSTMARSPACASPPRMATRR
ncbi:MAG: hypothetical protein IPQ17_07315 [Xanthomonadales bacterium]|nr:hypothetical protein [Xanthomonadales bacterium]